MKRDMEIDTKAQPKQLRSKKTKLNRDGKNDIKILEKNLDNIKDINDLISASYKLELYSNIDSVVLWKITPVLEELRDMIGMTGLKETLFQQILYYIQKMHVKNLSNEYLHTMIYGSPGTGKSSVAEIIARLYQGLGILSSSGPFKIAHRDDMVAGYLGQTSLKTNKLLKSCIGGILFIDEIYALAPRDQDDRDSYSNEALDTLTPFLSEHKHDFCCIGAGYEKEIQSAIFSRNPGMRRRFPWVHRIEKYSSNELSQIFLKMLEDINWKTNCTLKQIEYIISKNMILFPSFAGDVETYLTKCKISHSTRIFGKPKSEQFILSIDDLNMGITHMKKSIPKRDEPPHGFYI